MLSRPDFENKKIIFVNTYSKGSDYGFKVLSHTFCQVKDGHLIAKTPLNQLFTVCIVGNCTITTPLLKTCKEYGINLLLLNKNYSINAEILTNAEGNYELRGKQYNMSLQEEILLAQNILKLKLTNQARMLKKYGYILLEKFVTKEIRKITTINNIQELMSLEGRVSKVYFNALFKDYGWVFRKPQTKADITNFLMDIGYTYLFNICDSLLRAFGFDTYKGVYHRLFFKRKSLACDVMEPFRVIIDEAIIKGYRLKIISEKDFIFRNGQFMFKSKKDIQAKYAKLLLEAISENKLMIYEFILSFYRHIMNPEQYKFPKALYPKRTSI